MISRASTWAVWTLAAGGMTVAAQASVVGLTVQDWGTDNHTLTSLTVNRSTGGVVTYVPSQLIGVNVTDIAATGYSVATQWGHSVPPGGQRAALLEDDRLDTGLINPFSTGAPADQSFEVTFTTPVVNWDGDDIVVLELGGGDPTAFWVNNDRVNHRHDVIADDFNSGRLSNVPFTQYAYENPSGGSNVDGLTALEDVLNWGGVGQDGELSIAGLGLDLSDFGIALGQSVTSLRWQTTSTGNRLDAVYIAGLPVPEPASLALLAGGVGLLARRRRV